MSSKTDGHGVDHDVRSVDLCVSTSFCQCKISLDDLLDFYDAHTSFLVKYYLLNVSIL